MDRELRDKWVAKLRDPETKQCKGALEKNDSNCCLGVLCNAVGIEKGSPFLTRDIYFHFTSYDEWKSSLPPTGFQGLSFKQIQKLYKMNDSGSTFPEIADWIEQNIPVEG